MNISYTFGRGDWKKSALVGLVGGLLFIIAAPIMVIAGIVVFVLGITGFLKQKNE